MSFVVVTETSGQQYIHKVSLSPSKPVLIGRAWHNDVIVKDQYIDACHLQLSMTEDGTIQVSDLGTKNGSRLIKRRIEVESPYTLGSAITIGDSSVALYDTEAAVAPAQRLDSVHLASRIFGRFSWVFAASLAAAAGVIGSAYYVNSAEATSEMLAGDLLGFSIIAIVWCLLASFVGKLFRHKTYAKLHWLLVCVSFAIFVLVTLLVDLLRFNLDSDTAEAVLVNGSHAILIVLFSYATLSLSTRLRFTKKLAGACVFALLPALFNLATPLLEKEHERWTDSATAERVNQPPALLLAKPIALQMHIQKTDLLFAKLDAQVEAQASDTDTLNKTINSTGTTVHISGID